jgi:hypothetical protein
MSREEVQKLLGGYATGTLTPEEQQALFEAALDDQELFDALAKEQPLHDLLRDPAAKAAALAALDAPARGGWLSWVRRPWVAGLAMASLAAVGVAVWRSQGTVPSRDSDVVAQVRPQEQSQATSTSAPAEPAAPVLKSAPAPSDLEVRKRTAVEADGNLRQDKQVVSLDGLAKTDKAKELKDTNDLNAAAAPSAPPPPPVMAANKPAELQRAVPQQNAFQANGQAGAQAIGPSPYVNQNMASGQNAQNLVAPAVPVQQGFRAEDSRSDALTALGAQSGYAGFGGASGPGGLGSGEARKKATPSGVIGGIIAAQPSFRFSVIRSGAREADASTALTAGEAVKLRIVPSVGGFLYVKEGDQVIANAPVTPNQQFETQDLSSNAAGERKFEIILSQVAIVTGAGGGGGRASSVGSLRDAKSEKAAATAAPAPAFAVSARSAPTQQPIVQTITLTWK